MLHSVRKAQGSGGGGGGSPPAQGRPSSVQSQPHSPDTEGHRSATMALGFHGLAPATVTGPARKLLLTLGKGWEWGGQDAKSLSSEPRPGWGSSCRAEGVSGHPGRALSCVSKLVLPLWLPQGIWEPVASLAPWGEGRGRGSSV